jgi:glutaredoxin 3
MIKVYSKPNCPFCMKAKYHLEKLGVAYTEIDISQDTASRDWLVAKGHRTVPQLYIGEVLLVEGGYQGLEKLTVDDVMNRIHHISQERAA